MALALAIVLALGFGLLNGLHDAGNVIAPAVATRAISPGRALVLAAAFHVLGGLTAGTAVAATIASVLRHPQAAPLRVVLAGTLAAMTWSGLTLVAGLPCSSGHCLVGGLAGAALAEGGAGGVRWGGLQGLRPTGVVGSVVWLAASSAVVLPAAAGAIATGTWLLRRARRTIIGPVRVVEAVTAAALAYAHGANDAQKGMGLLGLALLTGGADRTFQVPLWVALAAVVSLTAGTSLGGWNVVRTLGRGIYRLTALDGAVAQGVAGATVLAASLVGAPVSTTDVVAPALIGVGAGERRHHVRWVVARRIGLAWLVTLPAAAALGAGLTEVAASLGVA